MARVQVSVARLLSPGEMVTAATGPVSISAQAAPVAAKAIRTRPRLLRLARLRGRNRAVRPPKSCTIGRVMISSRHSSHNGIRAKLIRLCRFRPELLVVASRRN